MSDASVESFIARYSPEVAADLRAARRHVAALFPRGYELVYDNYNALVFGFSPSDKAGDAVVSIAAYPKWVTLFFLEGKKLADPKGILEGEGNKVRSVRLDPLSLLEQRAVQDLLRAAISRHSAAFKAAPRRTTVVKSISKRQRPRRPKAAPKKRS